MSAQETLEAAEQIEEQAAEEASIATQVAVEAAKEETVAAEKFVIAKINIGCIG